jgi:hypothetical protein
MPLQLGAPPGDLRLLPGLVGTELGPPQVQPLLDERHAGRPEGALGDALEDHRELAAELVRVQRGQEVPQPTQRALAAALPAQHQRHEQRRAAWREAERLLQGALAVVRIVGDPRPHGHQHRRQPVPGRLHGQPLADLAHRLLRDDPDIERLEHSGGDPAHLLVMAVLMLELGLDHADVGLCELHRGGARGLLHELLEVPGQLLQAVIRLLGPQPDLRHLTADQAEVPLHLDDQVLDLVHLPAQRVVNVTHEIERLSRYDGAVRENGPELTARIDLDEVVGAGADEHPRAGERFRHRVGRGIVLDDRLPEVEPVVDVGRPEVALGEHAEWNVTELALVLRPDPVGQLHTGGRVEAGVEAMERFEYAGVPRPATVAMTGVEPRPLLSGGSRPVVKARFYASATCEFHSSPGPAN